MAFCEDPALTYLNGLGYNVVRLPRTGIEPLDVLGRNRDSMQRLRRLPKIWRSATQIPTLDTGTAIHVSSFQTNDLKFSFGIKLLESLLQAFGADMPQLGLAFSQRRCLRFSFGRPRVIRIDPLVLDEYLAEGDLITGSPFVLYYFNDDRASPFVITEVLQSDSFSVIISGEREEEVTVDVPTIESVIGTEVSVKLASGKQQELAFQGKEMLTFGFKVYEIALLKGYWHVAAVRPGGNLALLAEINGEPAPTVFREGRVDFL